MTIAIEEDAAGIGGGGGGVTTGLMSDDRLESQQEHEHDNDDSASFFIDAEDEDDGMRRTPEGASSDARRRLPYLPDITVVKGCKGSIHLAFLSHACFVAASLAYVALSFVDLAWVRDARGKYNIPEEVMDVDDDETWDRWESGADDAAVDALEEYDRRSRILSVLASALFAVVGVVDWMRYRDGLNVFMILAGVSGMVSGLSETSSREDLWNCISVHLYLLEAFNLLRRKHDYEGHAWLRVGDVFFLLGSVLDVLVCYLDSAGLAEAASVTYTDMTSCSLWLACALIELGAEIYFLEKGSTLCY